MILECHLLFKIIIRICKKMLEFCGKPLTFLAKSCGFIFCIFCLIEEDLIHQLHPRKYIDNDVFYATLQKTSNTKGVQKHNPTS